MNEKPVPTDDQLRDHLQYSDDYDVGTDSVVSRGDFPGAYVQCWVWVDFNAVEGFEKIDYYEDE